MAEPLDLAWFHSLADDDVSRCELNAIAEIQRCSFRENQLFPDSSPLCLRLDGNVIWLERGAAFSALEVYQEIFRSQDHGKVPGFLDDIGEGCVLDLGANFGFFTLNLKRRFPACKVWCVEPNPYVFPYLCRNIEANGLHHVTAIKAAVADRRGLVTFPVIRELPAISGRGLAEVDRPWMRDDFMTEITVEGITVGDVIANCGNHRIALLKMDIEGTELEALSVAGEALRAVRRLVVEYHSDRLRGDVVTVMANQGFEQIADIRPPQSTYYGDLYFENLNWSEVPA